MSAFTLVKEVSKLVSPSGNSYTFSMRYSLTVESHHNKLSIAIRTSKNFSYKPTKASTSLDASSSISNPTLSKISMQEDHTHICSKGHVFPQMKFPSASSPEVTTP